MHWVVAPEVPVQVSRTVYACVLRSNTCAHTHRERSRQSTQRFKTSSCLTVFVFFFAFPSFICCTLTVRFHFGFLLVWWSSTPPGYYCCVIECTPERRKDGDKDVLFYVFWKDHVCYHLWVCARRRDVKISFRISCNTSIFSKHFVDSECDHGCKKRGARFNLSAVQAVFVWCKSEVATGESLQHVTTSSKSRAETNLTRAESERIRIRSPNPNESRIQHATNDVITPMQ